MTRTLWVLNDADGYLRDDGLHLKAYLGTRGKDGVIVRREVELIVPVYSAVRLVDELYKSVKAKIADVGYVVERIRKAVS